VWTLLVFLGGAASAQTTRTLLLIDATSTMRQTDPGQLRKTAAELFVDLAQPGDLIGVTEFDREVRDLTGGFVKIDGPASREKLKTAIRSVGSDGQWTDFGAAFRGAADQFAANRGKDEKRILVFLTDGRCDPAPDDRRYLRDGEKLAEYLSLRRVDRELRCRQYVAYQISTSLAGIDVISVGFSSAAPKDFLDTLALKSGGRSLITDQAADLPRLFARIHAHNTGAQVVEPKGTALNIDPFAKSLDIVVVETAETGLEIFRPDWTPLALDGPGVQLVKNPRYTLYRIAEPAEGAWTVKSAKELSPNAVVAIANFNLQLVLESPGALLANTAADVKVRLVAGEGGPGPGEDFLQRHNFSLEVRDTDGGVATVPLTPGPDGQRGGKIPASEPGTLEVVARIDPGPSGSLAKRAAPRTIEVLPPIDTVFDSPFSLGRLKVGEPTEIELNLVSLKVPTEELSFKVGANGLPLKIQPEQVTVTPDNKSFKLTLTAWDDAPPGGMRGALALEALTEPYDTAEAVRVPVDATVVGRGMLESYGVSILIGLLVAVGAGVGLVLVRKRSTKG
jgi:hypothetical protein